MDFYSSEFVRKFSTSTYKSLKLKLGEMTFHKDFVNDGRGDLYPLYKKSADCIEKIDKNQYTVEQGDVSRMICQFFPFASYEVTFSAAMGEAGFIFALPNAEARIAMQSERISFSCGTHCECAEIESTLLKDENTLIVSCRPGAFDIYLKINGKPEFLCTVYEQAFADSNAEKVFTNSYTYLYASGKITVNAVSSYIDSGVSLADIRPIRYEDGEVIYENGKIHFTASIRMQENSFQGVFSWVPGTAELELCGAMFYDAGDGKWRNYLAPVLIYNRIKGEWHVWVSSFEHKHVLAYAAFDGEVRFGVNVIDVRLMQNAPEGADISLFAGFKGDEDPDLIYDKEEERWLMAICRLAPETKSYVYTFWQSDNPFENFKYIGRGYDGAETGGSFVRINGVLSFVCGNGFDKKSEYRIYQNGKMSVAKFNYPDGGFRGWGSLFKIKQGGRDRYFWLTFDRHNGSEYNWSYGNFYCFEMTK